MGTSVLFSYFDVRPEVLGRLSPEEAVTFFRKLLWAEARRCGVAGSMIDVPSAINVADGGIDASVDLPESVDSALLCKGKTRFQIKTGAFSARNAREAKELVANDKGELRPRVRACLEADGAFVAVLFGSDKPDRNENATVNRIREAIRKIEPKFKATNVRIIRQNQIVSLLEPFPSLRRALLGRNPGAAVDLDTWDSQDDMQRTFHPGDEQLEQIEEIRTTLRGAPTATHIHVAGEPGIGKTRLVLEALRADYLSSHVLYHPSASAFLESELFGELRSPDAGLQAIVVLDECDATARAVVWNAFRHLGKRIVLITIYSALETRSGTTKYVQMHALSDEQIQAILREYQVPQEHASRWAELCGGSPRFAHMLGRNLRDNPCDLLQEPDTACVFERIIDGCGPSNASPDQRRIVLRCLALFTRVGVGNFYDTEQGAVARIAREIDPNLTDLQFSAIVKHYRDGQLLQGEHVLYITFKLLHLKLWKDFWEKYGHTCDPSTVLTSFVERLPGVLRDRFHEMFQYAAASPVTQRLVKGWLGASGPFFRDEVWESRNTAEFFLTLTNADAERALEVLKLTIGKWGVEKLKGLSAGRRAIVNALERMAMWRDLFVDSARLLLALAEAENEDWANSATGVFREQFSLAYGPIAPTEAAPEERIVVLREALRSESATRRGLGIKALETALSPPDQGGRMVGAEYQGLRQPPRQWTPKTYGEWYEAYRLYWKELEDAIGFLESDEKLEAVRLMIEKGPALARYEALFDMVMVGLERLVEGELADRKHMLTRVVEMLRFDAKGLKPEHRVRIERLRDRFTGTTLEERLRRYAGIHVDWEEFDADARPVDTIQRELVRLAEELSGRPEVLREQLGWLTEDGVENGVRFGVELGRQDPELRFLDWILNAQRRNTKVKAPAFLSGYLRDLANRDREAWEKTLDRIAEDSELAGMVVEITWRGGLTDRGARRLLALVVNGRIPASSLGIFVWGREFVNVTEVVATECFHTLMASDDAYAPFVLIDLIDTYYLSRDQQGPIPRDISLSALFHPTFFGKSVVERAPQMAHFHWGRLAKACVEQYPDELLVVAEKLVEHFGEPKTVAARYRGGGLEVLSLAVAKRPRETWELLAPFLGPPMDARSYSLWTWLRGDNPSNQNAKVGMLRLFPMEVVFGWVEVDPPKRAPLLAEFVPATLVPSDKGVEFSREVLIRYGEDGNVQHALFRNFLTGTWWGPEHLRLSEQRERYAAIRKEEQDPKIRAWLDNYLSYLEKQHSVARAQDEAEGLP